MGTGRINRATATRFLTATHGAAEGAYLVAFLKGCRRSVIEPSGAELVAAVEETLCAVGNDDVYVLPAIFQERPEKRGRKDEAGGLVGFVVELDVTAKERRSRKRYFATTEAARNFIRTLPAWLRPSFVVNSGHGLHLWWVFKQPWLFHHTAEAVLADELWKRLGATLARLAGMDVDTPNLVQPYRLPGAWNYRYDPPRRVLIEDDTGVRIDPLLLGDRLDPIARRSSVRVHRRRLELPQDLPAVPIEKLRVSVRIKRLIVEGHTADLQRCPSRSEAVGAVTVALVAAGYDDVVIAAVLLNPSYAISDKPGEQSTAWVAAEIASARGLVADGTAIPTISAVALADSLPVASAREGSPWRL